MFSLTRHGSSLFKQHNNPCRILSFGMNRKAVLNLGVVTYAALMVLAVYFYKERMVMMDASLQLFESIRLGTFHNFSRFGAGLTHFFPILTSKLGWSLQAVAISYSISYIVLYAAYFFIILLPFDNPRLALCLLFYNVLMVTHSFYWVQCEAVQGAAFSFLYIAAIEAQIKSERISPRFIVLSPLAIITIVWFYPLLPFLMVFAIVYLWLYYHKRKTGFLFIVLASYIVIVFLKMHYWSDWYDSGAIDSYKNFFSLYPDYFSILSQKNFLKYCIDDYYFLPVLMAANTLVLIAKRRYLKMLLSVFSFFALMMIINVCHPEGAFQFYLEPQYSILTAYVAFPFVYDVLPCINKKALSISAVSIIVIISQIRIWNAHDLYTGRLNWYRGFLDTTKEYRHKKMIVRAGNVPMDILMMDWGTTYEFWLLSTLESGGSRIIIAEERPGEYDRYLKDSTVFIRKWDAVPIRQMQEKEKYFRFQDVEPYYQKYPAE